MFMYPKDNIFSIYYNIGRRTPFQVKRCAHWKKVGVGPDFRYTQQGRTFMVERVEPKGRYGRAFGYCLIDGVRNDDYMKNVYPDSNGEIPCAGCGEWTLVDVPGVNMNEIFPVHSVDEILLFGKYKGKSIGEVYKENPKYLFWLAESDPYYKIDFAALMDIDINDVNAEEKFRKEIERLFPKVTVDNVITFGKYKGKTYREIFAIDAQYIDWFLRKNTTLDIDMDSFRDLVWRGNL